MPAKLISDYHVARRTFLQRSLDPREVLNALEWRANKSDPKNGLIIGGKSIKVCSQKEIGSGMRN